MPYKNIILSRGPQDDLQLEDSGHFFIGHTVDQYGNELHVWLHPDNGSDRPQLPHHSRVEPLGASFLTLVELIGELSFGAGLPSTIEMEYIKPVKVMAAASDFHQREPIKVNRVGVQSYLFKPILDVIYRHAQAHPDYNPLKQAKETIGEYAIKIRQLEKTIENLEAELDVPQS